MAEYLVIIIKQIQFLEIIKIITHSIVKIATIIRVQFLDIKIIIMEIIIMEFSIIIKVKVHYLEITIITLYLEIMLNQIIY